MKKTRYYFKIDGYYNESCDWGMISIEAAKKGIRLYKDKTTNEIYCYEDLSSRYVEGLYAAGEYRWNFVLTRTEEVDVKETVTKLPKDNRFPNGYNWKNAHIYGANARLRKPNPKADPYNPSGKPPINPKTGLRDGKA